MLAVVTPEEMAAIDRGAPEPVEVLIGRAGAAVAHHALRMLGGAYGKRVVVVAGKGNNGNDGRDAAQRLRARGVRVEVLDAAAADGHARAPMRSRDRRGLRHRLPRRLRRARSRWRAGARGRHPVGRQRAHRRGLRRGGPGRRDGHVRGAQARPGAVAGPQPRGPGPCRRHRTRCESGASPSRRRSRRCGMASAAAARVAQVAGRGVDRRRIAGHDRRRRARGAWRAGRRRRLRAPQLAGRACGGTGRRPHRSGPHRGARVRGGTRRCSTDSIGSRRWWSDPGSAPSAVTVAAVRRVVAEATVPAVVDGDGLTALGEDVARYAHPLTVMTPHDGEYERLAGPSAGCRPDRGGPRAGCDRWTPPCC